MVGRWISFWNGLFSGSMLVSGRVSYIYINIMMQWARSKGFAMNVMILVRFFSLHLAQVRQQPLVTHFRVHISFLFFPGFLVVHSEYFWLNWKQQGFKLIFPPNQETMTSILEDATNHWCLQTGNYRLTTASVYHGKSRTFIQMYGIDGSDAIGISDVSCVFAKF